MIKGILLDIEGTTTPISFVYDVLFPFARTHIAAHITTEDARALRPEYDADRKNGLNPPEWSVPPVSYVRWLMDEDRKLTALKQLQGRIWLEGYERGKLHGEVFKDVPAALKQWRQDGIDVRIYSSGSILSQKLLFSSTAEGDLTPLLNGYFDTTTGSKNDASSYTAIAAAFGGAPDIILFVSDVTRELDAAQEAGFQTALCIRPGNRPQIAGTHRKITSFAEIASNGWLGSKQ